MITALRNTLRSSQRWIRFRELQREGFLQAWRRWRIQRQILPTPPVHTDREGDVEVRVLTWRRDWVNLIWALKSFYHFSGVRYPLYIHDGGLLPGQAEALQKHFPNATIIEARFADEHVINELKRHGLVRSARYRQLNPASRKIFDYAVFSTARRIIGIDSDIIFFAHPAELLVDDRVSRFNRDIDYAYSIDQGELDQLCGMHVPPRINSGLFAADRESIDLALVDEWLAHPALYANRWVTEQTLHAMLAARHRMEFLPPHYLVDTTAGLSPEVVCKHYPGFERPLLYFEGMKSTFFGDRRKSLRSPEPRHADPRTTRVA